MRTTDDGPGNGVPEGEDEPLRRLREAAPTVGVPDLDGVRRLTADRVADGEDRARVVRFPPRARPRRRREWLVAAAALVVACGGGFAVGAWSPGPGHPVPVDSPVGPGTGEAGAPAADSAMLGVPFGRTVFHDGGLPTQASSGTAWTYDPSGIDFAATASRAARGLGVPGEVRAEDGWYAAGSIDGTAAMLSLHAGGTGFLSYDDPGMDPWGECPPSTSQDSASTPCDGTGDPARPEPEDAVARVREKVEELGVDVSRLEWEVDAAYDDDSVVWVRGTWVIDGQRIESDWTAGVTSGGVWTLSGSVAPLVQAGTYPVIGPAEAVRRLNDPRFGPMGGTGTMPEVLDAASAPAGGEGPVVPGAPIEWPVDEVVVTGARLVTAPLPRLDEAVLLVPVYEMSAADGRVWTVLAVAEEGLSLVP